MKALADVCEFAGPFYEQEGDVLVCIWCKVTIDPDGRQAHVADDETGDPCPVGILDRAVLDVQGVPLRAPA